jgi:glycosyltransferase involved in cell wall biosynthesis
VASARGRAAGGPLVTVLINNYNYGRFLASAIESALAQSYARVEVVVVDDGSTDESRTIISRYGERIVPVLKENGGQASAFNAGFLSCRGDIVTFLDADDMLDERVVERVVEAFGRHPEVGLVQSRLRVTDAAGIPVRGQVPRSYVRMPMGDLRGRLQDLNNGSWWAPTSGISVSADVLRRVLPLPEQLFRISADIGLSRACALCAPVLSLRETGGSYRSHGRNYSNSGVLELTKIRDDARRFVDQQHFLRQFADEIGVEGYPTDPYSVRDIVFWIQRVLLVALGREDDALDGDTRLGVGRHGIRATLKRPDVGPGVKLLIVCWFVMMVTLPRPMAQRLAERTLLSCAHDATSS